VQPCAETPGSTQGSSDVEEPLEVHRELGQVDLLARDAGSDPADLVKSRGQPSASRPRCFARSVAYPGASLKGQCGRPSLSRRPVHQSLYRARERRESRVPFGPHPLRGYKALDSRHSLAVWISKKPAASPVLAGPGASPARVETPEPQGPGQHKRETPPPAPRPASPHAMEKSR